MPREKQLRVAFYQDAKRGWRWRARAKNGNVVADSGKSYKRRSGAVRGATATLAALLSDLAAASKKPL